MPANAAIYIQEDKVDLSSVFEKVKSDKSFYRKPTYYEVTLGEDVVRFNLMPKKEIPNHIQSFLNYIKSLNLEQHRKDDASYVISNTQIVIGLVCEKEFDDNHAIWKSLFRIADKYNGYVFSYDSLLLPSGGVIFGPLLESNN